jgi:endonuclease III
VKPSSEQSEQPEREQQIASLLLAHRKGTEDWGEMATFKVGECPKKVANQFLLCCLLDYQMPADLAWQNGKRLVEVILHDPQDVWNVITSYSRDEWASKSTEHKVHRFVHRAHDRLWRIGYEIRKHYNGDAREIWASKQAAIVLRNLLNLGVGEQISNMVVGALRDCGYVIGSSDVKADVHVCRVLGRSVAGAPTTAEMTISIGQRLNPDDPWQLDWPTWNLSKSCCYETHPNCVACYLTTYCAYAQKNL